MRRFWLILAAFLGLAATALPASADVTYTLNTEKDLTSGHNFGTITLHQDAGNTTTVQVTVQLNTSIAGMGFAKTDAGYAIAFDLKGVNTSTGAGSPDSITIDSATPVAGDFAVQKTSGHYFGAYKASPFTSGGTGSKFEYAIDYTGKTGSDNKLVFDVTRNSGLSLSDFATGNSKYQFAVDIITTAGATRDVAVPESPSWTFTISGLMGLVGFAMVQRRRKSVRAA